MEAEFPGQNSGQEVVKVVLVGDNGVGKTRLVCARAYLQSVPLVQLVKTHGECFPSKFNLIFKFFLIPSAYNLGNRPIPYIQRCVRKI